MDNKTALVCWSGGLDSTRLICHYLDLGYSVHALSIKLLTNPEKCKREEQARQAMFEAYFKNYDFKLVKGLEIFNPTLTDFYQPQGDAIILKEAIDWLLGLLTAVRTEHDEVAIGYVADDVLTVTYCDRLSSVWDSFGLLTSRGLPPLKFPLVERKKDWMYETLPQPLKGLVTWCNGSASVTHCGQCDPCRKMISYGLQKPRI
jgi:7-cyano-7-deazaguanine synthase in queuosine biosynthesis